MAERCEDRDAGRHGGDLSDELVHVGNDEGSNGSAVGGPAGVEGVAEGDEGDAVNVKECGG